MAYWLPGIRLRPEARPIPRLPSAEFSRLHTTRARLRVALLATLALAGCLAFVVFPQQQVAISADGEVITILSRQQNVAALLETAGVRRDRGDVFVVGTGSIKVERAVPVVVEVDGVALSWRTRAASVAGVLHELGIDVSPHDAIAYNGLEVTAAEAVYPKPLNTSSLAGYGIYNETPGDVQGVILSITRAVPFSVVEDTRRLTLRSSAVTVGDALRQAGISLGPADEVYPSVSTPLTSGLEVQVRHARAINLRLGQSTRVIYTHRETLEAALAEAGLHFGPDDRVEPGLDVRVTNAMNARLVRVTGQSFYERDVVQHTTVFRPDDSLSGIETRRERGSDGVRVTEYKIVIEDGVEVERTLVGITYDPEPADTVIYYSASALNSTGEPENLKVAQIRRMYATWYNAASAGRPPTSPHYGVTASGVLVTKGIVATDPRVIPLGTRLYIPGYGFAVAGDTGGGIIGDMIDLGYPDGVAVDWRTGWVDVYILWD